MRKERKARDDAKLSKKAGHTDKFIKAKQAVISLKAKIKAAKKNLRNTFANEKATKAKMRDNKATLVKITGKKQPLTAVKPRNTARFSKNVQLSFFKKQKDLEPRK